MPRPSDETLAFPGQMMAEETTLVSTLRQWQTSYLPKASEVQLACALRAWQCGWPMPVLQGTDLRGAELEGWHFGAGNEEADAQVGIIPRTIARPEQRG